MWVGVRKQGNRRDITMRRDECKYTGKRPQGGQWGFQLPFSWNGWPLEHGRNRRPELWFSLKLLLSKCGSVNCEGRDPWLGSGTSLVVPLPPEERENVRPDHESKEIWLQPTYGVCMVSAQMSLGMHIRLKVPKLSCCIEGRGLWWGLRAVCSTGTMMEIYFVFLP